jgi:hypothetical protein
MTDTKRAVDSGSHDEKSVVRIARGSRDLATWRGRLIFNDLVIFSVMVGSLNRHTVRG